MCALRHAGFTEVWQCGRSFSLSTVLQHMCRRFPAAGRRVPGWERLSCQQLWGSQSAQRATVLWVGPVSAVDLRQLGRGKKNNGIKVIPRNSDSPNPCCIRVMVRGRGLEAWFSISFFPVCLINFDEYPINPTNKRSHRVEMRTILVCPCSPQCTKPCGGGIKTRLVVCQRPNGERFNDLSCEIHDKPPDREQCNTQPCPSNPHWSADAWSSVRS